MVAFPAAPLNQEEVTWFLHRLSRILVKWYETFQVHITCKPWEIGRYLLLDSNRKSTVTLHFTLSDIESSKSGLIFRFRRVVVCKGVKLGDFLYSTKWQNHETKWRNERTKWNHEIKWRNQWAIIRVSVWWAFYECLYTGIHKVGIGLDTERQQAIIYIRLWIIFPILSHFNTRVKHIQTCPE